MAFVISSAIIGGISSNNAANKAANAQTDAAKLASDTQLQMYNQSRADQAPWLAAGSNALSQLAARTGSGGDLMKQFGAADFQADPGYDFRMSEGMKGINNSAAARGGLLSGAALKAASQYNQNFASNEYGNAYNRFQTNQTNQFNRLASIAGVGQTAANQNSNNAMATGNSVASNQIGAGNARASGYIGQGNAVSGAIGQGYNMYQGNQLLNSLNGNGGPSMAYASSFGNPNTTQGANLNDINGAGSNFTGL